MNASRPICSRSSWHTILQWSRSGTVESSQRLRSTQEEKTIDWRWFHDSRILVNLSQPTAQLERHASKQWNTHLDMRITFNCTVLWESIADNFCCRSHEHTLRWKHRVVARVEGADVPENRRQPRSTFLTDEERRLLVARINLFHSALVLKAVADGQWHQKREIQQNARMIWPEARPWRDVWVSEDRNRCSKNCTNEFVDKIKCFMKFQLTPVCNRQDSYDRKASETSDSTRSPWYSYNCN